MRRVYGEKNPNGKNSESSGKIADGPAGIRPAFIEDQQEPTAHAKEVTELAEEVLAECRSMLMMRHRFLDTALWQMGTKAESGERTIATDGVELHFDPMLTIMRYHDNSNEAVRDYLHMILHCVFRHPFDDTHMQERAWSLACDILVESIAMDMAATRFPSELDDARRVALKAVREICGTLNASRLYRCFREVMGDKEEPYFNEEFDEVGPYEEAIDERTYSMLMLAAAKRISPERGLSSNDVYILSDLFVRDGHEKWDTVRTQDIPDVDGSAGEGGAGAASQEYDEDDPRNEEDETQKNEDKGRKEENKQQSSSQNEMTSTDDEPEESPSTSEKSSRQSQEASEEQLRSAQMNEAKEKWEEIAKQIEMELESNALWGSEAGDLTQELKMANRSACDYELFLRRFTALKEDIKTNEEEFDYIYYTYGLDRYGNMPLVEPLEYMESERVREFVIALDTSESCEGDLIATFVRRTFEIIKGSEVFGSRVNLHIVQCDAKVQCDDKIESTDDLDEWLQGFEVRGLGGTSFEPVFEYVDDLIEKGEFEDLSGLIYFTDGMGSYPYTRPAYDTAFVFMSYAPTGVKVPPWAMKVVMTEDEVREL